MPKAPQRVALQGPTFIRLLAGMSATTVPDPPKSLPERLSQWIDWTRAIAVAKALDGRLPATDGDGPAFDADEDQQCLDARQLIVQRIDAGPTVTADGDAPAADYAPFQKHYLEMQRAMQATSGRLRGRLRDMLARRCRDMARLAEMDAVMELTLSPREQSLLATVPALLGQHFERLREAAAGDPPAAAPAWLRQFRSDMRGVLHAELDVRFQPIDALLAALRTR